MSKEVITANSYRLMGFAAYCVADQESFWALMKQNGFVDLNRNRQLFMRGPAESFDPNEVAIVFRYTCEREQFISDGRYYFIRSLFVAGREKYGEPKHLVAQTIFEGRPRDYGWQ